MESRKKVARCQTAVAGPVLRWAATLQKQTPATGMTDHTWLSLWKTAEKWDKPVEEMDKTGGQMGKNMVELWKYGFQMMFTMKHGNDMQYGFNMKCIFHQC